MNTSRGLYQFNRLSFGVKSAPGIYQRCMDNLFASEAYFVSYQSDILITGSLDAEYLDNLDRVLKKLSASWLAGYVLEDIDALSFLIKLQDERVILRYEGSPLFFWANVT